MRILEAIILLSARHGSSCADIIRAMSETGNMRPRVEKVLDKVRPAMQADGGDARVVECDEEKGKVSIEMLGACGGCPLSQLDFVYAIESLIRREVPEVRDIVAV
jgi:Fe-S cluster biogenesis protein NfuA